MVAAALLPALVLGVQEPNITNYIQTKFEDATFVASVGSANFTELKKVNADFSQSYRFKSSQVWLKEPFKLKMVSTVDDTTITFLVVGTKKYTRIPKASINLNEDVSKKPGKRQTLFDFGMLAPSLMKDLFQAKFVRNDRATGDVVFDLTYYPALRDSSRHRVWIDPEKKIITKREWYGQAKLRGGRLMASFKYENPVQQDGVWIATKASVFNAENKLAGTVNYTGLKVNQGIADSIFVVK